MANRYDKATIADIIEFIDTKKILLPAIQRKFVWGENQITKLMDSIMQGYPFGTFLFWKVKKRAVDQKGYSMFEFIKNYHERDRFRNEPAGQPFNAVNEDETILSALDGQQRLTSLYIALKGSISMKLPKKHWNSDDAFPVKELYLDLYSGNVPSEDETVYRFAFLTTEQAQRTAEEHLWFRVKEINGFMGLQDITQMIIEKGWIQEQSAARTLSLLFQRIKQDELINYFEYETDLIDDVLDIFVRINSGGMVLSKTDLLFSTIVSSWNDARKEIDELLAKINKTGEHYSFTNDFIMKACLYVTDARVKLKVDSFNQICIQAIKNHWGEIKTAIVKTVEFLNKIGFTAENIVAENAILPLVYYCFKCGNSSLDQDKEEVVKYIIIAQIRHIFGQSTDTTLTAIRKELQKHIESGEGFRFSYLQQLSFTGGERNLQLTEEDIEGWLDEFEKGAYTFMLLSLLYPNLKYDQNQFHQDHMHPYSEFDDDDKLLSLVLPNGKTMDKETIALWRHQRNTLPNLQLLEGNENTSKNATPLQEWLLINGNKASVKYLPNLADYSLNNFDEFIEKRKEKMLDALKTILL